MPPLPQWWSLLPQPLTKTPTQVWGLAAMGTQRGQAQLSYLTSQGTAERGESMLWCLTDQQDD